jgi:hypothetical protein
MRRLVAREHLDWGLTGMQPFAARDAFISSARRIGTFGQKRK